MPCVITRPQTNVLLKGTSIKEILKPHEQCKHTERSLRIRYTQLIAKGRTGRFTQQTSSSKTFRLFTTLGLEYEERNTANTLPKFKMKWRLL